MGGAGTGRPYQGPYAQQSADKRFLDYIEHKQRFEAEYQNWSQNKGGSLTD